MIKNELRDLCQEYGELHGNRSANEALDFALIKLWMFHKDKMYDKKGNLDTSYLKSFLKEEIKYG